MQEWIGVFHIWVETWLFIVLVIHCPSKCNTVITARKHRGTASLLHTMHFILMPLLTLTAAKIAMVHMRANTSYPSVISSILETLQSPWCRLNQRDGLITAKLETALLSLHLKRFHLSHLSVNKSYLLMKDLHITHSPPSAQLPLLKVPSSQQPTSPGLAHCSSFHLLPSTVVMYLLIPCLHPPYNKTRLNVSFSVTVQCLQSFWASSVLLKMEMHIN